MVKLMKHSLAPLIATIKQELKIRSLGYRDVAQALGVSENSIKIRFSTQRLSYAHIATIAELLGLTMSELMLKMERPKPWKLTAALENNLLSNMRRLLVLVRIQNDWTVDDIVETYDLTRAECIKYLLELQKLELIELLPNERVRKLHPLTTIFAHDGPFQRHVIHHAPDFFDHPFDDELASFNVLNGMLSSATIKQFQEELRALRQRFMELHEESRFVPLHDRHSFVMLLSGREWELPEFAAMRKKA